MNPRIVLLVAVVACGESENRAPPPESLPARAMLTKVPQDSGVAPPHAPQAMLSAIDATAQSGSDRVVFEFAGEGVPGYHVEYVTRTVRCGSGDPVSVQGTASLLVRFEPARAHDDQGRPTLTARERTLGLPALTEWKLICDFEGQVEFVLGVTTQAPYRVSEEGRTPPRLILEVRHTP